MDSHPQRHDAELLANPRVKQAIMDCWNDTSYVNWVQRGDQLSALRDYSYLKL
jgi:hypothetical protein